MEGGTLQSRPVLYVTRKPFLFSSLGHMLQFDTIKFRRYFGQFVWIEKKMIEFHEAPTKYKLRLVFAVNSDKHFCIKL